MPNIAKCFFDVKKRVEAFYDGLGQSKHVVIGRLSSSKT